MPEWFRNILRWVGNHPLQALGGVLAALLGVFYAYLQVPQDTRNLVLIAFGGVLLFLVASIFYARRNSIAYYLIVLTWDENHKDSVLTAVARYFSRQHIPKSETNELVRVSQLDHDNWQDTLKLATERLNSALRLNSEIHFACHAYWMWCFALGTLIQDQYPLTLYHSQDATHHKIWRMSRDVKNRKAVTAGRYAYRACRTPERIREGKNGNAVGLVFACGSHDPCPAVLTFSDSDLPDVPLWVVRLEGGIDPKLPMRWIDAASDLANAVDELSESGRKEVYLFGTAPDTLGLMVGSAVGPYRRIHLMQYQQGTYRRQMTLQPHP